MNGQNFGGLQRLGNLEARYVSYTNSKMKVGPANFFWDLHFWKNEPFETMQLFHITWQP